jgi:flagellar hook-length control protein FliK
MDSDSDTDTDGEGTSTSGQPATATVAGQTGAAAATNAVAAFLQTFQRALASSAQAAGADPLGDQTQTNDPTAVASNGSNAGSAQSLLASLGALQNAQSPSATSDATLATQTSPSTSTTDPDAVVAQLLRGISMRDLGETSQIRLRLVPESLGDLSVKLTVDHSGSVSASVLAQTPQARDALIANQAQLTRSLSDAGLKLTSFSVDLSNSGANMFGQQQQQPQPQQQRFGIVQESPSASDDAGSDQLLAVPSFAPPVTAAAGAGSLNYLV